MSETIVIREKKKRGRKAGVKVGSYNKNKDSVTTPAGVFRVKEYKNKPLEEKPKEPETPKEEQYKPPGAVLDEIEDIGRANFEAHLNSVLNEAGEEEEEQEEENKEEKPNTTATLNQEFINDNQEFEEEETPIIPEKGDANNQLMSGSIMFVIWDMFIPGVAIWLYGLTASPENKAKLKKIDRTAIGLSDDQKEEMEKMGLATEVANILFSKMPKWVAFLITGLFFSYMNVKIHVSTIND